MEIPELQVITESVPENSTTFKNFIERRTLLKTKLKLLQIEAIDQDLKQLHHHNLTLPTLKLDDFYLTSDYQVSAPLKKQIMPYYREPKLILQSYLVYLSYLYNFNFEQLLEEDPDTLIKIIFSLNIPVNLKSQLLHLLNNDYASYFSEHIISLATPAYREALELDKTRLRSIN